MTSAISTEFWEQEPATQCRKCSRNWAFPPMPGRRGSCFRGFSRGKKQSAPGNPGRAFVPVLDDRLPVDEFLEPLQTACPVIHRTAEIVFAQTGCAGINIVLDPRRLLVRQIRTQISKFGIPFVDPGNIDRPFSSVAREELDRQAVGVVIAAIEIKPRNCCRSISLRSADRPDCRSPR